MLLLLLWLPGSSSAGIGKIGKTIANQHWAPHFPDQKLAGEIEACWVCKKMQLTQNMLWIAVSFLYTFVCAIICNHILNNVFCESGLFGNIIGYNAFGNYHCIGPASAT